MGQSQNIMLPLNPENWLNLVDDMSNEYSFSLSAAFLKTLLHCIDSDSA